MTGTDLKLIQHDAREARKLETGTVARGQLLLIELLAEIARRLPPPLDDDE